MARVKIAIPEHFTFSTQIPVRIQDVNYGGHVGNDAILSIMHEARLQFLGNIGCTELDAYGVGMIMSDVAIVYKGEGFRGDVFLVEVTADELSPFGFDLVYRLSTEREGKKHPIAEGKTGMICFDYGQRKVTRLPEALKAKLIG
ncbi:thioesterase family protein [Chitinophaga horti]|uniref:Thioesterase family protein n=1 Tax=Chitinophaga horti TaxID=2920382 RepID=A0ABY6J1W0_9BACT|nr:thioesterase family protein [Chitinophaga horti]UYQ93664.1 thioesterase family protein [Chitinophaga horti]